MARFWQASKLKGDRMSEWMVYAIGAVVIIIAAVLVLRHVNRDPNSPGPGV